MSNTLAYYRVQTYATKKFYNPDAWMISGSASFRALLVHRRVEGEGGADVVVDLVLENEVDWRLSWCDSCIFIIDRQLCSQILNVPNEKNRCVILSNGNGHLIDTIHPAYHDTFLLCANMLIFVPTLPPSLQMFCLSLILSVSPVVSSLPLFLCHT